MAAAKIKDRFEIALRCNELRAEGKRIGFTSGVFDILHAGHVDYLEKAKNHCDILAVGINSDASVREYKGHHRPIVPQDQRARIVAGLSAVDFVFIFDDRRNHANVEALRPDVYIKAGDYAPNELTSARLVEAWGGELKLIPVEHDVSSTAIMQRIADQTALRLPADDAGGATFLSMPTPDPRPAVFLDRDGTINEEVGFLHDPTDLKLLPGALEGLRKFQDMGYRLIVATNQGGIGLGYFTHQDFYRVNSALFKAVAPENIRFDKVYFCPHSLADNCPCRKPRTGMILRAASELNVDLTRSVMIGDRSVDVEAGRRAGLFTILVRTGSGGEEGEHRIAPDLVAEDISDAADIIAGKTMRR